LDTLLRWFALLFHTLFAAAVLILAVISALSPPHELWFPVLPWSGRQLAVGLASLGVLGILVVWAAARGKARLLWLVWSVVVLVLIVRGYWFSDYRFTPESSQLRTAFVAVVAALVGVLGAKRSGPAGSRRAA
jgi:hypothetical protein